VEERPVHGADHGLRQVVDEDLDLAAFHVAPDADAVPRVVPVVALRALLRDADALLAVDEEDRVRVRIGGLRDVDIVEVLRVLPAEEEAKVAVAVVLRGRLDPCLEDDVGGIDAADQRVMERRAYSFAGLPSV
jgi:hypothetical protein